MDVWRPQRDWEPVVPVHNEWPYQGVVVVSANDCYATGRWYWLCIALRQSGLPVGGRTIQGYKMHMTLMAPSIEYVRDTIQGLWENERPPELLLQVRAWRGYSDI